MPEPIAVDFHYEGRKFDFQIHEREITFGSAGKAPYYWMDGRQLRQGTGGPNFRPCVDLWWHGVEVAGAAGEVDNEINLVFAECYPLVNTAKAVQEIYVDAHLRALADREYYFFEDEEGIRHRCSERTYLLPEDECSRLRAVAHSRDLARIRGELEGLFLGDLPPEREMPAYQEAARAWIGNGIGALRRDGRQGLRRYTQTVDDWIRKLRRRGRTDRARLFLNMFSYECKVAFYCCYVSAWVGILDWLSKNREPNTLAERFMRFWHHQNCAPDEAGRDVFCGQILALHPLSAVVLTSPEHLTVIGRWIGHPEYESITTSGQVAECAEYWDFVATVLIAAYEYDRSRTRSEEARHQTVHSNTQAVTQLPRDDAIASARMLFEDYAAARGHLCRECSAPLTYLRHELVDREERAVAAYFRCSACGIETAIEIGRDDITP